MKKALYMSLAIMFIFVFVGCTKKEVNKELIMLDDVKQMVIDGKTADYIKGELEGFTNEELISKWGEPDNSLSGLYGDIWKFDDEKGTFIIIYYDNDGKVMGTHVDAIEE